MIQWPMMDDDKIIMMMNIMLNIMMMIFNYIAGCTGVLLFSETDPFHYGSVMAGIFSTYQVKQTAFLSIGLIYRFEFLSEQVMLLTNS